jgi:sporulation-control protein spo0M
MKTYQDCIREYDGRIPHKADLHMGGFLDAIVFVFGKHRDQVVRDIQAYRSDRYQEEDEDSDGQASSRRPSNDRDTLLASRRIGGQ